MFKLLQQSNIIPNFEFKKENYKTILTYLIKNNKKFYVKSWDYITSFNNNPQSFFNQHQHQIIITQNPIKKCFRIYYKQCFFDVEYYRRFNKNTLHYWFNNIESGNNKYCNICISEFTNGKINNQCPVCVYTMCDDCMNKVGLKCPQCRENFPVYLF